MPKKVSVEYVCEKCGSVQSKWYGRCPSCQNFNTFVEREKRQVDKVKAKSKVAQKFATIAPLVGGEAIPVNDIRSEDWERILLHSSELNSVLGGGLTPGSVILLGGAPGAGKSTMLSSVAGFLANEHTVLYASAEESAQQIKLRLDRLGCQSPSLYLMTENNLENILEEADRLDPIVVIVDSIQMVYTATVDSSPGTVTQVRECATLLNNFAKTRGIAIFIIGHVTKSQEFGGPKILEHIVDTTLYLEGDEFGVFRILRSIKNRFGATSVGVFEMRDDGFRDVPNPSELLMAERAKNSSGTAIAVIMEGTKPLMVEVQALVSDSEYANPSRNATGFERNRVSMLADVMSKHVPCDISSRNIMVNVVGGLEIEETAVDLPMAVAMLSSMLNKIVPPELAAFGEIDLTGAVRSVSHMDTRVREAQKIGMKKLVIAKRRDKTNIDGLDIIEITNIKDLAKLVETFDDAENISVLKSTGLKRVKSNIGVDATAQIMSIP